MKTKIGKKLLALLLAAATIGMGLMGCGAKEDVPAENAAADTAVQEEKADPAADEGDAAVSEEEATYYNKTGFPICDEPITISVSGADGRGQDWNQTALVRGIKEKMGIQMECTTYSMDAWATQLSLMMADDELPDLILTSSSPSNRLTINQAGMDGYFLDLTQYLDIMPNFAKVLENDPTYAAAMKAPNGAIYAIDNLRKQPTQVNADMKLLVSKANLEKYDIDPESLYTTEGFYNALKKIKEADPDKIPLSLTIDAQDGQRGENIIRSAFGIYSTANYFHRDVDENGNVVLLDITDNYREYLKYMNKLYEEGLLDRDAYIMTVDEFQSKIKKGDVIFWNSWDVIAPLVGYNDNTWVNDYVIIKGMTSEFVDEAVMVEFPTYSSNARVFVSADTEYPEAICRLIDYIYTDEGIDFFQYGVEGVDFEYVENELGVKVPNTANFWDQENYDSEAQWRIMEVTIENAMSLYKAPKELDWAVNASDEELQSVLDNESETLDSFLTYAAYELAERQQVDRHDRSYGNVVYTEEEADKINTLTADLQTYIAQMKSEFIRGEADVESDAEWNAYVEEVEKIGLSEYLEIEQASYERFEENSK